MSVATFPQEAMTWLGRLPAGWQVKPLKHVVRVNPEALSDSTDPDWRMTYADISSVSLGQGIVDAEEFAFADAPSRARRLVKAGDTLVSTVRTYLRAITVVREPPENLVASTGFAVLRPGSDIDPNFLGYFATSDAFVNAVVAQSVGVSYPATNAFDIVRLPIAFPDIDQQQKIAAFLDRKTAEIDT
ncbi:MAG: restriction endonuclease subunit S, partial [Spiribacter salinus]